MLDDMLEITIDQFIPPLRPLGKKINNFELIYCEMGSIFSKDGKAINARQNFSASVYPLPELAQSPLCKQCIAHRYDEDIGKSLNKDCLQSVKNVIDNSSALEACDYVEIIDKLIQQLSS